MMKYFWILPFLAFLAGYYGALHVVHLSETTVPHVAGLTLHEGMALISSAHLSARLVSEREDSHMPDGVIMRQFPSPGTRVKIRSPLDLVVSKKPIPLSAPTYQGLSYDQVITHAAEHHMRIREHWLEMGGVKGIARAQYPAPGMPSADKIVHVYFSSGSARYVLMPDVRGKALKEVRDFLARNGIEAQMLMRAPVQHEQAPTIIVDQKPGAHAIVDMRKPPLFQLVVSNESHV